MRESKTVLIWVIVLLAAGFFTIYLSIFATRFNFYKSELKVSSTEINEKLYYEADKDYHTLYRSFSSELSSYISRGANTIHIEDVACSAGEAYARFSGSCDFFPDKNDVCPAFTEKNEYGCSFGASLGFFKGNEYSISSRFILSPENIFVIDGKEYIKFVAYSGGKHKFLILGKNLFIEGNAVSKRFYFPGDDVIIYIPYAGESSEYSLVQQDEFYFDTKYLQKFFMLFFAILPAAMFFIAWRFYGKEKTYEDVPPELSAYPRERNAWEIASFFHPPFSVIDQEFFSSMLLSLYHKKAIDIRMEKNNTCIKTLAGKDDGKFDEVERAFISFLDGLEKNSAPSVKESGYLNLNKALSIWNFNLGKSFFAKDYCRKEVKKIEKIVKKESKKYIESGFVESFMIFTPVIFILAFLSSFLTGNMLSILPFGVFWLIFSIVAKNSSVFIRYKESYYIEYQRWKSFGRYLANSYSIKSSQHKGVVLWQKYLVYASALGVASRVLKELKQQKIITDEQYHLYHTGIGHISGSFSTASGTRGGGHGGGFGGGGGIGGGGGGGR